MMRNSSYFISQFHSEIRLRTVSGYDGYKKKIEAIASIFLLQFVMNFSNISEFLVEFYN